MAVSGARTGFGAKVEVGVGAIPVFTNLLGLEDFNAPAATREDINVSSHSSPGVEEYIPSPLLELGSMGFRMDYVPESASDTVLTAIKASGEIVQLRITIPGKTDPEIFAAYLKKYDRNIPYKNKMVAELEFKIAGIVEEE